MERFQAYRQCIEEQAPKQSRINMLPQHDWQGRSTLKEDIVNRDNWLKPDKNYKDGYERRFYRHERLYFGEIPSFEMLARTKLGIDRLFANVTYSTSMEHIMFYLCVSARLETIKVSMAITPESASLIAHNNMCWLHLAVQVALSANAVHFDPARVKLLECLQEKLSRYKPTTTFDTEMIQEL